MENINKLLDKYFDGITSDKEEIILKEYFSKEDISPQHEMYKPLFSAFEREKQIVAPKFTIPDERNEKKSLPKRIWITAASVAAAILLIILLNPLSKNAKTENNYLVYINGKEITNQEKAQQYAEQMFMQAEEIIRVSYQPFEETKAIKEKMDADKIFNDLSVEINNIESIIQ